MHIRNIHGKIGKNQLQITVLYLRMNETYLHDQMTKRQLDLLDRFLAFRRQYSHVAIALIGVCLFEMSLNAIVNGLSVMWRWCPDVTLRTDAHK